MAVGFHTKSLGPEVIKLFSCLTQLSMNINMLIDIEKDTISGISGLIHQSQSFILLINVGQRQDFATVTFSHL